jgi:hypothetical protein
MRDLKGHLRETGDIGEGRAGHTPRSVKGASDAFGYILRNIPQAAIGDLH